MYGKVFTSLWDGSLYGKLEASATLMACVTLCNAQGILDLTPEAIAGRTGWPLEFIRKGITELEQPDPRSRTPDENGCRFVKLDDHRDWGWLIVNYEKYRTLSDSDTIKEQNKLRARKYRESHHAASRSVTHSNAHITSNNGVSRQAEAEAEAEAEGKKENPRALGVNPRAVAMGLDEIAWQRWFAYRREIRKPLKPTSVSAAQQRLAAFGSDQSAVVEQSIANGWTGLFALSKSASRRSSGWE